jgi:hypothetical protein
MRTGEWEEMKKQAAIFATGAVGYSALEILARGYTHWTMTLLGGLCLLAVVGIGHRLADTPLPVQAALGAGVITAAELCTGLLVNLVLGWRVWDYSAEPGHFLGQICPRYSVYWFFLCVAVLGTARLAARRHAQRAKGIDIEIERC